MRPTAHTTDVDLGLVDAFVQLSMVVGEIFSAATGSHGVPALQARLLGVLRDREPTMADLGRLLGLDKSSTTGLIDRAQRRGLVRRVRVPEDRRSYRVALTDEGWRLAAVVGEDVTRQLHQLADHLSGTDQRRLSLLMSSVVHHHAAEHGIDLSAGVVANRRPDDKGPTEKTLQ